jgi:hypothetical protein
MEMIENERRRTMQASRKKLIATADKLWSLLVRYSFNHRCVLCGKHGTDAHHWRFGRSFLKYRWEINNGVCLCRAHHSQIEVSKTTKARLLTVMQTRFPANYAVMMKATQTSEPVKDSDIAHKINNITLCCELLGLKIKF